MSVFRTFAGLAALALAVPAAGQPKTPAPSAASDVPEKFVKPEAANDYVKRVEMAPMRDGTSSTR